MSDETPDTPETPKPAAPDPSGPSPDGADTGSGDPAAPKRRPKDSEFFELPPDLKKLPPGGLPATMSSGPGASKPDDPKGGAGAKKSGCAGLVLFAAGVAGAAASAVSLLFLA